MVKKVVDCFKKQYDYRKNKCDTKHSKQPVGCVGFGALQDSQSDITENQRTQQAIYQTCVGIVFVIGKVCIRIDDFVDTEKHKQTKQWQQAVCPGEPSDIF
ncbi:MAG: hypothetical protein K6G65_09270 [Lachnospiraceae bacterium]|nr:hypothetical protein [Lachnospiraceae bacterium]